VQWIVLFIIFVGQFAQGFTSFESSLDMGYYRDIQKKAHSPFLYRLSYLGFHEGAQESQVELSLYNDFNNNQWTPMVSKALFVYPLDHGFDDAPFRKSRIQLGRQLLAEGFDFFFLDGVTVPYYFSKTSGFNLFLGQTQDMDLSESLIDQIYGVSFHKSISDLIFKTSTYSKGDMSLGNYLFTEIFLPIDSILFQPIFASKWEWDLKNNGAPQSLNMIDFNLSENTMMYLQHSFRNPRSIKSEKINLSIFNNFSKSFSENQEIGLRKELNTEMQIQGMIRKLRFNTGTTFEDSTQEELRIDYTLTGNHILSPSLEHIISYGGEVWILNFNHENQISDLSKLYSDLSIAYMSKVNQIHSWLYQLRSGYETRIDRRWKLTLWGEIERNHIFTFDTRIKGNVAYFY